MIVTGVKRHTKWMGAPVNEILYHHACFRTKMFWNQRLCRPEECESVRRGRTDRQTNAMSASTSDAVSKITISPAPWLSVP